MFEARLPADCERLVWKAYFTEHVLPDIRRDVMERVYAVMERLTDMYCSDMLEFMYVSRRVDRQEWELETTQGEIEARVFRIVKEIKGWA
jgi:hypothetical protein